MDTVPQYSNLNMNTPNERFVIQIQEVELRSDRNINAQIRNITQVVRIWIGEDNIMCNV